MEDYFGTIISDITGTRRGHVISIEENGEGTGLKTIISVVPLKEMVGYSTVLRTITKGTGNFTMELDRLVFWLFLLINLDIWNYPMLNKKTFSKN